MAGVSFDASVLIALDRGDERAWAWMKRAAGRHQPPIVCAAAVAEAWRDGRVQARLARALNACDVRPVDEHLAKAAGEALAAVGGGTVDAVVAACAARDGALLVTDDPHDLRALADGHFRALKVATLTRP